MSPLYETIKSYYERGLWNKQRVYNVVGKTNGITAEEYETIIGEVYK